MVEPILYAATGFLLATLLWLLFIPAFWRRAVRLTQKRLLGKLPISATEIIAAQDRLRAEHAMTMRVVERRAEQALEQSASDRAESGRARSAILGHMADASELKSRIAALETEGERLKGELAQTVAIAEQRATALKTAEDEKTVAVTELTAAREDGAAARLSVDQARIEAAAREGELASLRGEIQTLRAKTESVDSFGSGDDLLRSLRLRLDEVADSIAKATGATAPDQLGRDLGRSNETEVVRLRESVGAR